ncbi:MAG: 2-oxo acid dehydrogenase subunit E2 [Thaumarchaeota archaeon]|nr:2-oxo acid dehydrogenase subunit E2 [Nitrososphaerota archaeon]
MVTSVPMPKLGAGVYHEGVILRWMKQEGDYVEAEESIAEIETDKAVATYQSPAAGTVLKILFKEGEVVQVGTPILLLGQPGEEVPPELISHGSPSATGPAQPAPSSSEPAPSPASGAGRDVSPAARRLAENLKVDLSKVSGTGPRGSIMREDILKAARGTRSQNQVTPSDTIPASQSAEPRLIPLSAMRATIADRLTRSQRETAHVTLTREVEVASLVALVKDEGAASKFGYNDVFIKATARALKQHQMMNAQLEGDQVRVMGAVNIGVAVAVEGGLITPSVGDADGLALPEIAETIRRLSEKARNRQLTPEGYAGATFTVSNLGAYGVETFTPIINPPQVGILGIGRVAERPWVEDGELKVRPTVHLSLTFDHRVIDGADAALFLDTVVRLVRDLSWIRS